MEAKELKVREILMSEKVLSDAKFERVKGDRHTWKYNYLYIMRDDKGRFWTLGDVCDLGGQYVEYLFTIGDVINVLRRKIQQSASDSWTKTLNEIIDNFINIPTEHLYSKENKEE